MIRFAVLNPDKQDKKTQNATLPQEIELERALDLYSQAIRWHQRGRVADAKAAYETILRKDWFEEELPSQP
ncbi:hypothetical protein HK102_004342, partial [Quaeritorhiza haematococci]